MEMNIKDNIESAEQLERLYQSDKKGFEKAFEAIYPEVSDFKLAEFWRIRLASDNQKTGFNALQKADIGFLIVSCIVAAFLIKIPWVFGIDFNTYMFYEKNAGLIVLFGLSLYFFLSKKTVDLKKAMIVLLVFAVSAIYINLLPNNEDSNSTILANIHLPLMLWCLAGMIFIDFNFADKLKRIDYIKFNGDLAILGAIILISGGILTAVTIGLFSAIEINIEKFYVDFIVIGGLVCVPIVATFIIKNYAIVTNKIAPIIASIFSPLVLITLVIYLISIVITGKDPYNDRDFLIVFNLMLLGVMAIIVFSVSETSNNKKQRFNEWILLLLSMVTLIIDLVALSAILYRLGEYGFTPNRTAVLGSNLLFFGNLVLIMIDLYRVNFKNKEISQVELRIAWYLPVYVVWSIFVVFALPFIFGLK